MSANLRVHESLDSLIQPWAFIVTLKESCRQETLNIHPVEVPWVPVHEDSRQKSKLHGLGHWPCWRKSIFCCNISKHFSSRKLTSRHQLLHQPPGGVWFSQTHCVILTIQMTPSAQYKSSEFFQFALYFFLKWLNWFYTHVYIPDRWELPAVFCQTRGQSAHWEDLVSPSHSSWDAKHCAAAPPSSPGTLDLQMLSWPHHSVPQVGGSQEGLW